MKQYQPPRCTVNFFIESAVLEEIFTPINSRVMDSKKEKLKYFWSLFVFLALQSIVVIFSQPTSGL